MEGIFQGVIGAISSVANEVYTAHLEASARRAIKRGDAKYLNRLINENKVNVNARDKEGMSLLHFACAFGRFDIFNTLIGRGADCLVINLLRESLLHSAAKNGNEKIVGHLIKTEKLDVNAVSKGGATPLHFACASGNWNTVELLIENEANCYAVDCDNRSCLHYAAENGHARVVDYFLNEKELDFSRRSKSNGLTAFYLACMNGHLDAVKILLDSGADVNEVDDCEKSALIIAAENKHKEVFEYLIFEDELNLDKDSFQKREGENPLISACELDSLDAVKRLIGKGWDYKGCFHHAALHGSASIVRYMIDEKGLDVDKKASGFTALMMASIVGDLKTVKLLIEKEADCNAVDSNGFTCLHYAAHHGRAEVVEYLVEEKKMNIYQESGSTLAQTPMSMGLLSLDPRTTLLMSMKGLGWW